ncbi:LLM class F420-dependent oxidoreductase [Pseudohaliea sp.]|uniref:LLM class F420-dependent oxidoreductase n=1 Tax=Pseudohaliea sp. TaxID=2740289 RepID=UPI0032EF588E
MKIGLLLGYAGQDVHLPMDLILEAEKTGFESVWVSEVYGSDVVTPATWILAQTTTIKVGTSIMQIPARSPANAAQTLMTLSQLSGGRFMAGFGSSGPQVVEGWHGVPFGKALTRSREYFQIIRKIMAREKSEFDGEIYQLPYRGEGSVGLGKPLRSILRADNDTPIYSASFTPGGLRMSAELTDGVIPIFMSPEKFDVLRPYLEQGFAKTESQGFHNFEVMPFVPVSLGDDLEACRLPVKEFLALYVGGMGAKAKNFYNDYAKKLGYPEAAVEIQDLYLSGKKAEAVAAVPDELVDEVALVGDAERIRLHAEKWKALENEGIVRRMIITMPTAEALPVLADIFID